MTRGSVSRSEGEARPRRGLPRAAALALLVLLGAACGRRDLGLQVGEPDFSGGLARLEIQLGADLLPDTLKVWLDGRPLRDGVRVEGAVAHVELDVAAGPHLLAARARAERRGAAWDARPFRAPPPLPAVVGTDPAPGSGAVPVSAWLVLELAAEPEEGALASLGLACDGLARAFAAEVLPGAARPGAAPARVVVNPDPALPASAHCALAWRGPEGTASLAFGTSPLGAPVEVLYDREQDAFLAPFPDDYFLEPDASTPTGWRVQVPLPQRPGLIGPLFDALLTDANQLDGWSPLAPLVVETAAALDPASLPRGVADSLDPLASVQLLDLDAEPPARVPFRLQARSDTTAAGASETLLIFPGRPLDPGGRYALALTTRALADPARPAAPSDAFAAALGPPVFGEAASLARVRERLAAALAALEGEARPRIPREDLALVLPIHARSTDDIPRDLLAMRAQVQAAPPPELLGFVVEAHPSPDVAAVVRGTWDAPDWRPQSGNRIERANVVRDADGLPQTQGTRPVEFVLALPQAALDGPVPVVMHQHGNPGSQEEVVSNARRFLAAAGFATIGFTDILNREVAPPTAPDGTPRGDDERIALQVTETFLALFLNRTLPDYWLETTAEQLAFLRFVQSLGTLDVLPLGAPDGVPDLDLAAPLAYHGISEGGNNGQAILPYAPEFKSAALVVGGARLAETLVHQQAETFLEQVPAFVPGLLPAEIWVGVSLFQTVFDRQDRQSHLAFAYANPVEVGGTRAKASALLVEGLDDSLVPNGATESAAWVLGVPQLDPLRPVPFLDVAHGGVRANVDPDTTGALVQYAPTGLPDLPPTPGCAALSPSSASEGHYCAQSAAESQQLRVRFFRSALEDGAPEIADPYAAEVSP